MKESQKTSSGRGGRSRGDNGAGRSRYSGAENVAGRSQHSGAEHNAGRSRFSGTEHDAGRSRPSGAEKVAGFWPLAVLPAAVVTCALWYILVARGGMPWRVAFSAGIATAYLLNSLFTIWFYKTDKRLAEGQEWRIPEDNLHFWELLCGWPGALYAQRKYHHKWKKTSYMVAFWLYVVLNVTVVLGAAFPEVSIPLLQKVYEALKSLRGLEE